MAKEDPFFSAQEFHQRINRVREAMEAAGTDLLIVTDPANMAWLTGYDGWSFYVHQCVLLSLEGDPIWFGRFMDANGARRTVYMDDDHIIGYADTYVQSTERHPMQRLSEIISDKPLPLRLYFEFLILSKLPHFIEYSTKVSIGED